ncbi:helix-turn-helix transcriptional regulator [Bifidobacterium panos]|uniref:HTH cro/C1-type domain-containing protein n=1 Tax=Bifidobacterium panos TaxID=2675321 RepID=A0ABX1SZU8_9BIFI|nr:helix-turn-helix transcriptional regulator [Bifidobacterium sp. DSM 109963]NMN02814.1 hypothetical protein [Bifidobacterium sp. DSM 109963]
MSDLTDNEIAARNLDAERVRRRKTVGDIANALSVSESMVYGILKGDIEISITMVSKIAPIFDMSVYQLMMLLLQPIDSIKQVKA